MSVYLSAQMSLPAKSHCSEGAAWSSALIRYPSLGLDSEADLGGQGMEAGPGCGVGGG